MDMRDIRIYDLNRSRVDEDGSNKKKGQVKFKPNGAVELKKSDYRDEAIRPRHVIKWNRSVPSAIQDWEIKFGAEFVTPQDPYYPVGPGVEFREGKFFYREMVLMKLPLERYLKEMKENRKRSNIDLQYKEKQFKKQMEGMGMGLKEDDLYGSI